MRSGSLRSRVGLRTTAAEATLLEVARSLRPTRQRELRAFADFQFERSQGHRQKLWPRLQRGNGSSLVVAPPRRLPRAELWRLKGRYMFDIAAAAGTATAPGSRSPSA